jgi:hypothetical protein
MKKTDIAVHSDGYGYATHPAVNVKVHNLACTAKDVMAKFDCSEEQAHEALAFAYDSERRCFWAYWSETGNAYFREKVEVYSEGRSGSWLVVHGLPPVEEWDAVMVSRWAKFENDVLADVEYRMSKQVMLEGIEANQWWKVGSSQYNFVGKGTCLADVRQDVNEYSVKTHGLTLKEVTG